jgi:hypothetical protein
MSLFNPLVPSGLIKLSTDYKNVQNNFQQLDTSFGVNHFLFSNGTSNNGKHTFIELVNNVSIPTTAAGEATLYSIQNGSSLVTDIYMTPDASTNQYRFTNFNAATFAAFAKVITGINTIAGWTFIPGGLIVNYGFVAAVLSSTKSGTVTLARPHANCFGIWAQPTYTGTAASGGAAIGVDLPNGALTAFNWVAFTNSSQYDGFVYITLGN